MKRTYTRFVLLSLWLISAGVSLAQNQVTYGFVQDPVDQLKLTAVAYPDFTSNNVTISTSVFTFYLPAGTVTSPEIPVLPATGMFTDITGSWRIEKITPALYASFGFNPNDLMGNDIYQCILQNSPSPNTLNGVPVSLFSFRLPGDCLGGIVQVHNNNNGIQVALLNNVGININNQMSVSVDDAPSVDIYFGNNPLTNDYPCPLDDVPVAVDDMASTNEDTPVNINVTGNDNFGTDGPSTGAITINTAPVNGMASVDNNGTPNNPMDDRIIYTPNANYNGTDAVIYQICDADGDCDPATVFITVNAVNDPPVVPNTTVSTPEDTPLPVCVAITDTDNSSFTVTSFCAPDGGTVSNLTNPATSQYCLTYTPNPNYNGPDTLCILVCDGSGACDTSYVFITVTPVNDPPVANADNTTTPEDMPVMLTVNANDTDVDGAINPATVDLDPNTGGVQTSFSVAGGTFSSNGAGVVTFTPNLNFNGMATAVYQVCDTGTPLPAMCDTAIITVNVTPVNDPPVAQDDATSTSEDTPVTLTVTANDTDVDGAIDPATLDLDPNTMGIQTSFSVMGGTFSYTGGGQVTFTPNLNFNGVATAVYQVCDTGTPLPSLCDQATITITVTPVNDPPLVPNTAVSTPEDTPLPVCVAITDTDNSSFTVTSFCAPDGGTVSNLTNPATSQYCLTYTPNPNYNGPDTLCILVCDGSGACDTSYVFITVTPVNDPPLANNDNATTPEDTPVQVIVLSNDTDVDGALNPGSVAVLNTPDHGTATVNPVTGVVTYTPNLNFVGNDTLIYVVCDSGTPVLCDTASVLLSVSATSVRLLGVVRLQGALFNNPDTLTLMRDNLRSLGRLPKGEPYTALPAFVHVGGGGEMVTDSAMVFSNRGANSIVDWVFVELRNPALPTQVVATRSALLQRDGDIVDMDGLTSLTFENVLPASYYVAVRHRNHLGAMTANAVALTNSGTVVDFSNLSTPIWDDGTNLDGLEQKTINGKYALWAGNVNTNTTVVYAGQNNDKDPIFNLVDQAPGNFLHSQSFIYNGYHLGDVNMDGKAVFAGQNNDVDFIFNNVDGHPRNIARSQSFLIRQQLP